MHNLIDLLEKRQLIWQGHRRQQAPEFESSAYAELAKRFDLALVNYVGQLTGALPQTIHFYHPPKQFLRYLDLLFEVSNLQLLEKPLLRLLHVMEDFLRIQNLYTYK